MSGLKSKCREAVAETPVPDELAKDIIMVLNDFFGTDEKAERNGS